jgi:small-conductance mechanosensitive channel
MRLSSKIRLSLILFCTLCGLIAITTWWQRIGFPRALDGVSDDVRQVLTKTLFYVGGQPVRTWFLIKTALFLICLHIVALGVSWAARYILRGNPYIDKHRSYVMSRAVSLLVYAVGILIGIHVENINLSTLAIVGGTLGVGIGFGLQSIVSNFVSGIVLLIEQPIRLGDRIEFGERTGKVIRVGGRASWIQTYDNATVIVPNSELTSKQIVNWTSGDPKLRTSISISVAYDAPPSTVIEALITEASLHKNVMKDPVPDVILSEFGPYFMTFKLRVWTLLKANEVFKLQSDLRLQVLQALRDRDIQLSLPQLDVSIKSKDLRRISYAEHT